MIPNIPLKTGCGLIGRRQPLSAITGSMNQLTAHALHRPTAAAQSRLTVCNSNSGSRNAGSRRGSDRAPNAGQPAASPPVFTVGKESSVVYNEDDFVKLGEIKAAHGIRGEVKVDVSTDSPKQRFGKAGTKLLLRLKTRPAGPEPPLSEVTTEGFKIQVVADGKEIWILKLKEVQDRTQAEQLRAYSIVMPATSRERLRDPDEFYAQDLIGSFVFMQDDASYVGKVVDLFSGFGSHDTLLLQLRSTEEDLNKSRARTCMVPFVKEIVPVVDKPNRRILMCPPEGLLDLVSIKVMKPIPDEMKARKMLENEDREEAEKQLRLQQPSVAGTAASSPKSTLLTKEEREMLEDDMDDEEEDREEDQSDEDSDAKKQRAVRPPTRRRVTAGTSRRLRVKSE